MKINSIVATGLALAFMVIINPVMAAPDITVTYLPLKVITQDTYSTISADGRYLAYKHQQTGGGGNYPSNIYIHDFVTGEKVLANITLTGTSSGGTNCGQPAMSANGRYVVFVCHAASMGGATQGGYGYFVYDRINNKTEMIPDTGNDMPNQAYGSAISADGRYVAFRTFTSNGSSKLFVRDRVNKTTTNLPAQFVAGPVGGARMMISADGRFVSYVGRATSPTVPPSASVYDRVTGATEAIDVKPDGSRTALGVTDLSMSDDGRVFAFSSIDSDLTVPATEKGFAAIFMRDRATAKTEMISGSGKYHATYSGVSGNGRYIAFVVLGSLRVYDRLTKVTRTVVLNGLNASGTPRMSSDGRYVVVTGVNAATSVVTICVADMGVAPGVTLSANELTLTEGGIAGTYTMALTQAPDADVKVTVGPGNQLSVARTELVFTPENWSVPQVVSVQALSDGVSEGRHTGTIVHTVTSTDANFTVVQPANVTVTITDGIVPTIVVPATTWNRSDMPLTGTAAPGATVMLTAVNRSTGWMSSVSSVADAQGRWSYTMTGFTDGVVDLDAQAEGIRSAVQTVTVKLVVVPPQPTFTDVTGYIRTTGLSMAYNRATGKYVGNVLLTNTGSIPLSGPLHLQFDNLTAGITLSNATGSHNGSPYITVPGGLVPDGGVTIPLEFTNPAKNPINYDAKIYSGTF